MFERQSLVVAGCSIRLGGFSFLGSHHVFLTGEGITGLTGGVCPGGIGIQPEEVYGGVGFRVGAFSCEAGVVAGYCSGKGHGAVGIRFAGEAGVVRGNDAGLEFVARVDRSHERCAGRGGRAFNGVGVEHDLRRFTSEGGGYVFVGAGSQGGGSGQEEEDILFRDGVTDRYHRFEDRFGVVVAQTPHFAGRGHLYTQHGVGLL